MDAVVVKSVLGGQWLVALVALCVGACSAAGDGPRDVQLRPADRLTDGIQPSELSVDAGAAVDAGDAGATR